MIGERTFYLEKSNSSTIVYSQGRKKTYLLTLNNLIDQELEKSLSNMEGRLLSTKRAYNIKKLVPIYINQRMILQPIKSYKAWDLVLINICMISNIEEVSNGVKITSIDNDTLVIDMSIERLNRYIKLCKTILHNQNTYERNL